MTNKTALISVSDKTGLIEFVTFLHHEGIKIFSTGGTAKAIRDGGIPVQDVADMTHFPEMMDGRVKTLHPKVHGGILALRDQASHQQAMAENGINPIDMVVVNLYPFQHTVDQGADAATCIENIDIGGPAMIRSAAKNHRYVTVVVDPSQYQVLMDEMQENDGDVPLNLRQKLAQAAFNHVAIYDRSIADWFSRENAYEVHGNHSPPPEQLNLTLTRQASLPYGENPHQRAAVYYENHARGVLEAEKVQGKAMSYNNFLDSAAAFDLIQEYKDHPTCAIIKHGNPCGVAFSAHVLQAYQKALSCDRTSAFGGIIAFNRQIDGDTARAVTDLFTEVVIAPSLTEEAREIFHHKKNLRVLLTENISDAYQQGFEVRSIAGGFLLQSRDTAQEHQEQSYRVVTKRAPTSQEMQDLLFAFTVCKYVKSNAIVYAKNQQTVGIGAGQTSRVNSCYVAVQKAQEAVAQEGDHHLGCEGSVVASDAFFPFADGLRVAIDAGATAVIQPGGSLRDQEVIDAADSAGVAMVFTGDRHFRH